MGPWKRFSSNVLMTVNPHSGFVYPHSGFVCYLIVGGWGLYKHATLKAVFQECFDYSKPSQLFFVPTQWLCVLFNWGGRGVTLYKHGALKAVFQ